MEQLTWVPAGMLRHVARLLPPGLFMRLQMNTFLPRM